MVTTCISSVFLAFVVQDYFTTPLVFCVMMVLGSAQAQDFDVLKYGAVGDGSTDDSKVSKNVALRRYSE